MPHDELDPVSLELERQLHKLDTIADPASRSACADVIGSVLRFHSAALQRMLESIESSEAGPSLLGSFDRDPLIRSVLLVHDLHPESLGRRVRRAISDIEPSLQKRDAKVENITIEEEQVRVVIVSGANSPSVSEMVEQAIRSAAPEVVEVVVEEPGKVRAGFVPIENLEKPAAASGSVQK